MSFPTRTATVHTVGAVALLLALSIPAPGQTRLAEGRTSPASADVVRRHPTAGVVAMLRSRDGQVSLLLTQASLVLQLTDSGRREVAASIANDPEPVLGARLVSRMLGAAIAELLDHGLAYPLPELRGARAEGGRLVIEDRGGRPIFAGSEVNGRKVMEHFPAAEAERFAAMVDRAIRVQH